MTEIAGRSSRFYVGLSIAAAVATIGLKVAVALPQATVFTHLEPREDPVSWSDRGLDR